jgi:hypothetical protein
MIIDNTSLSIDEQNNEIIKFFNEKGIIQL